MKKGATKRGRKREKPKRRIRLGRSEKRKPRVTATADAQSVPAPHPESTFDMLMALTAPVLSALILPKLDITTRHRLACTSRVHRDLNDQFTTRENARVKPLLVKAGVKASTIDTFLKYPNMALAPLYQNYTRIFSVTNLKIYGHFPLERAWPLLFLTGQPHLVSYELDRNYLSKCGIKLAFSKGNRQAAHFAFWSSDVQMVKKVITLGLVVKKTDQFRRSCAHYAFWSGNPAMVDQVVKLGIKLTTRTTYKKYNCTAHAFFSGNPEMVDKAKALGLSFRNCALAAFAQDNPALVDKAIALGLDMNVTDLSLGNCIHYAYRTSPVMLDKAVEVFGLERVVKTVDDNGEYGLNRKLEGDIRAHWLRLRERWERQQEESSMVLHGS